MPKKMSTLSKLLNKALEQLRNLQLDNSFMYKNQHFIHTQPNEKFICIRTANNISFLIKKYCTELFGDGTVEYCPKYFMQLYTIDRLKCGFYVPLVYFFLKKDNSQSTCIKNVGIYENNLF